LDLEVFKKSFDYYRGNFKMFEKVIHYLHLNLLSHISCTLSCDNLNSNEEKNIEIMKDDILSIMNLVTLDLKASFNHISSFKKRYTNFKNKRFEEIELQNTITTIALFLLKEKKLIIKLIDDDSLFLYDLINYISTIVSSEESNKNLFIQVLTKGSIKENKENSSKIQFCIGNVDKIIENTILIFLHILGCNNKDINTKLSNEVYYC